MGTVNKILVTGANGFLGSRILKQLIIDGYEPVILLRKSADKKRIEGLLSKVIVIYLEDNRSNLQEPFDLFGITSIIHTATDYGRGKLLSDILDTNVMFPIQLIELGIENGLKSFINTDSFFAKPHFNQSYLNNYTDSKRILEISLKSLSSQVAIQNVRLEHIYGEQDSNSKFVTAVFNQLQTNVSEVLLTEGNQKRDFLYVDDAASAFLAILKSQDSEITYKEYEVGTGESISIRSFVELMAHNTRSNSVLKFGGLPSRNGDIDDSFADLSEISKLGWVPKFTVSEGINEMIKKYK